MPENDKCPLCGALIHTTTSDSFYTDCGSVFATDGTPWRIGHDCLTRQLADAQAVIDKLPRYADTGQPFVPGRDDAWTIDQGKVVPVEMRWREQWEWPVPDGFQVGQPYSTEAAALAAKEAAK